MSIALPGHTMAYRPSRRFGDIILGDVCILVDHFLLEVLQ